MSNKSRRTFIEQSGKLVLGAVIGGHIAVAGADEHEHSQLETTVAVTEERCATCEYWGGIRQISEDGQAVICNGTGWCNNPESRNYRRMTKPNQGPMPAWKQWGALS
ncbi:hypothetical protein TI03_01285 [Achromatium sp. WMS1]|nr:hypothetical protein TI03_01285 [Achromatium sp. WMS1]